MRATSFCFALLLAIVPVAGAAQTLVIGNKGEDSVSLVDLRSGRELRRIETASMPHEIAVSPDGRRVAVVAYGGQTIDLIDIASARRVERIDLAPNRRPHGIVWLGDGRIVATTEGSASLTVVRSDAARRGPRVRQVATGQLGSHMVAVSPDGARAYVANMGSASVSVIDLAAMTKLRDVAVGEKPEGIALSLTGDRLWVADRGGASVHVLDTVTWREVARLATGEAPIRVAFSPDGRFAITSNFGAGTLSVFDARTLRTIRTIEVSGNKDFQQVTILFSPNGDQLYVAETGIDRVAEVDFATGRVLGRLPAGRNGDGLAIASGSVDIPK